MNPQSRAAEPVIELARVEKVYRSGRVGFPALSGVDLAIAAGEMVAVTGRSASGKSTIARGSGRSSPSAWPRGRSGPASSGSTPARTTAA